MKCLRAAAAAGGASGFGLSLSLNPRNVSEGMGWQKTLWTLPVSPGDVVVRTNARITLVLADGPSDGAFSTIDVFLGASCWASEFGGEFGYSFESTLAQWDCFGNV